MDPIARSKGVRHQWRGMMTTSQLGDLNRWKRLRIAGTPLYKGLLMSEPRFIVFLDPQFIIVDEEATAHDDTDFYVDGFGVGYCLACEMGIFDAVGDLADETLDAIVRMPFRFHVVLVGLPVILVRIAVEREESLEYVSKRDVGVAGAGLLELFSVERENEG